MKARVNPEDLHNNNIDRLTLKTKFLQTVSALTDDIDKNQWDKAREKIKKMSGLLEELEQIK